MPILNITIKVRASFVAEDHRDAVVETAREGARQVLTNILMLTPSNSRVQPSVIMAVESTGDAQPAVEDIHMDMSIEAACEDPFAAM